MTAAAHAERLAKWRAALRMHFDTTPCGKVSFVEVQHENWCPTQKGLTVCLCNPDRVMLDDRRRVLTRIRGAGPYRMGEIGEAMA